MTSTQDSPSGTRPDTEDSPGIEVSRRTMITSSLTFPVGAALAARFASAQEPASPAVPVWTSDAQNEVAELTAMVINADTPLIGDDLTRYVLLDWRSRRALASERSSVDSDSLTASAHWAALSDFAPEHDLALVALPEQIVPESPVVLPPVGQRVNAEPLWIVILDILIDTLDLGINRELVLRATGDDEQFRKLLEKVAGYATDHDWDRIKSIADLLFDYVFSGAFGNRIRQAIVEEIGEDAALRIPRKAVFSTILRCVPVVGWVYLALCFVVAIRQNVHRFG